jgi:hypothetical protein
MAMEAWISVVVIATGCVVVGILIESVTGRVLEPLRHALTWWAAREPRFPEEVECELRSLNGTHHGIGATWTPGVASLQSGSISFTAHSATAAVTIPVTSIGPVAADETKGTTRNARVRVYTDEGILELSLQRAVIDRVRQIVVARV